jgi:GT2 family glycosyltransferase
VVDWRRPHETVEALTSLGALEPSTDQLICVENGCTPDEVAIVRAAAPPHTKLLEVPENIGFAAGVNLGVSNALQAGAEWILLLNNDATVSRHCLSRCLDEAAAYPGVAAVGPAISFTDRPDLLWYGGGLVAEWFAFTRHRGLLQPASAPPPTGDTEFVTGCCMLISAAAWRAGGPFRADFFAYYEDAEWCQRLRALGWRCRYVGEVLSMHTVGVSSSQRGSLGLSENTAYYLARNPIRFALETRDLGRRITRLIGLMTVWNAYNAWRLLQARSFKVVSAYLAGIGDAFSGRMGQRVRLHR